jgi:hypothetical protein
MLAMLSKLSTVLSKIPLTIARCAGKPFEKPTTPPGSAGMRRFDAMIFAHSA